MHFAEFESVARAVWETIPQRYREGVDGLIVDKAAKPHRDDPEVYTLGECVTEEYPSQYGGPDTIRSAVVLYFGSFREVARENEQFDWQDEIHETLTHELQHHLESLATEDALEDLDYAVDENFKRVRGEAFDPLFYRAGENLEAVNAVNAANAVVAYGVDCDVFLEVVSRGVEELKLEWTWQDVRYRAALPAAEADITYHNVDDGPDIGIGDFCIVRMVKRGVLATLRSAFGSGYTVAEVTVSAERVS